MQHLRGRIAKSDVRTTYHVPRTTYVPTHPALCLGTSVPRQKIVIVAHSLLEALSVDVHPGGIMYILVGK